jgi:hypothetical protein
MGKPPHLKFARILIDFSVFIYHLHHQQHELGPYEIVASEFNIIIIIFLKIFNFT